MTQNQQDNLSEFLQAHCQNVPKAPDNEKNQILSRIQNSQDQDARLVRFLRVFKWALPVVASAVFVFSLAINFNQKPSISDAELAVHLQELEEEEGYWTEDSDLPGDDFLSLAKAVSRRSK